MSKDAMKLRAGIGVLVLLVLAALGILLLLAPPAGQGPRSNRDAGGRPVVRVLFIGNSLTSDNDLPGLVAELSLATGQGPVIAAESLIAGGADLGDHWRAGAQARIAEGDWDFVVLQQGPSALPESREILLGYARTYGPAIRAAGARPAMYMVWPSDQRSGDFDRVCESYRLAAKEIDALLLPVGEAWRTAWRSDPSLPLYASDRFHPSPLGSYLAALVICARLTDRSPMDLPNPDAIDLPAIEGTAATVAQVRLLKQAAAEAIRAETTPATQPATSGSGNLSP